MSDNSTILSLPLIQANQAQKHITHNEAIRRLDALVQPVAQDMDRTAPPTAPVDGDRHIVAPGAIDDWAGQDGALAVREDNAWAFIPPADGWRVHVTSLGADVVFGPTGWQRQTLTGDLLGLNTAADTDNRLAVASPATLLTHDGAGHQLKLNRASVADTASLLFQSDWSGRAEMGIAGEDAFSIKVSADGSDWTTALRINPTTGRASGAAVQADAGDTGTNKLARADLTYGRGNAVAPVAMSGGAPTGGLLETVDTPDGQALKLADGTMICRARLVLTFTDGYALQETWTFPEVFDAAIPPVIQATASLDGASISADLRRLGALTSDGVSATGATITQRRALGGTDLFTATDTLVVHVTATGRWT